MDEKLKKKIVIIALLNAQRVMDELFYDYENHSFADEDLRKTYYAMNSLNCKYMNEPGVWV